MTSSGVQNQPFQVVHGGDDWDTHPLVLSLSPEAVMARTSRDDVRTLARKAGIPLDYLTQGLEGCETLEQRALFMSDLRKKVRHHISLLRSDEAKTLYSTSDYISTGVQKAGKELIRYVESYWGDISESAGGEEKGLQKEAEDLLKSTRQESLIYLCDSIYRQELYAAVQEVGEERLFSGLEVILDSLQYIRWHDLGDTMSGTTFEQMKHVVFGTFTPKTPCSRTLAILIVMSHRLRSFQTIWQRSGSRPTDQIRQHFMACIYREYRDMGIDATDDELGQFAFFPLVDYLMRTGDLEGSFALFLMNRDSVSAFQRPTPLAQGFVGEEGDSEHYQANRFRA